MPLVPFVMRWRHLFLFGYFLTLLPSSSFASMGKVFVLFGDIEGAYFRHFDRLHAFGLKLRLKGYEPIVHFNATQIELQQAFRGSETIAIVWIGHSLDTHEGIYGADKVHIPRKTFRWPGSNLKSLFFISCCTQKSVVDYYDLKRFPNLNVLYFPGDHEGFIQFDSVRSLFDSPSNFKLFIRSCSQRLSVDR